MARKDMVLVYRQDPRWYITEESDLLTPPVRTWYQLWWGQIQDRYTRTRSGDEVVEMLVAAGLDPDPGAWREPTEEERRPRREG